MNQPIHANLEAALTLPGACWTAKTRAFALAIGALWECDRTVGAWVNLLHAYEQDHGGESLALRRKRSGVRAFGRRKA
jgi:hypothetical protein